MQITIMIITIILIRLKAYQNSGFWHVLEAWTIVVRNDKRLLWLVHMISVFYIAIRKRE
jgi:hypothetical protein